MTLNQFYAFVGSYPINIHFVEMYFTVFPNDSEHKGKSLIVPNLSFNYTCLAFMQICEAVCLKEVFPIINYRHINKSVHPN